MNLEIGAGGRGSFDFDPKFCVSCDLFLDISGITGIVKNFIIADAHYLPFKDCIFKNVMLNHVIEHLNKPGLALKEIYRVLSFNGKIEIYTPNFSYPGAKTAIGHIQVFNYFSLKKILVDSGFKQIIYMPLGKKLLPGIICKILIILFYGELKAKGIKYKI